MILKPIYDTSLNLHIIYLAHGKETSYNTSEERILPIVFIKIVIIAYEILSLILTPYILWFRVSQNSGAIIDFFRDYSIHVDGLGYVCYFAMFNFEEKDKNMMADGKHRKRKNRGKLRPRQQDTSTTSLQRDVSESELSSDDDEIYSLQRDDKMARSYYHFMDNYNDEDATNNGKGQ